MSGLKDWQRCCENIKKYVDKSGRASYGTIQGSSVNVDGKLFPYKLAVPMSVTDGSKVFVHITDGIAVIIGG